MSLALALDVPDAATAAARVRQTASRVDVFKIGLQLFCAEGPRVVDAVREAGARAIFLDLKLHDIPNTVAGAVRSLDRLGVDYLTVHTSGGRAMLEAAAEAAGGGPCLLGVTVLTSLDATGLDEVCVATSPEAAVLARGRLATQSGIRGLVCSPHEAAGLRDALGSALVLVTPGIRAGADVGDQKRVATPARAVAAGASMLVLGRAVTAAADPVAVLDRIRAEVA